MEMITGCAAKQLAELAKAFPAEDPYPWVVSYDKENGCLIVVVQLPEARLYKRLSNS